MSLPEKAKRPLRVLQMCAVDFTVKQFLLPVASALQRNGYQVDVACARGPYFDQIRETGINMVENPISRSANVWKHLNSLRATYKLLKREKYDVVHVHTPIAALLGRIAAKMARVPVKIYTAHGFYFHDQMTPRLRRALILLERIGSACGDFIMTVSKEDEQSALKLGIARPGQVETIYNGVDTERFDPARFTALQRRELRDRLRITSDAYVIGIVGRLVREKGFFELFEAAKAIIAKYPNMRVMVVGDVLPSDYDGTKHEVHARLQELGIADKVAFAGMVDDTAPYLHAMDAFTLPSYREGMPISLLEAMSMALPCVATDIRGCREEVVNGESGWLVPSKDASALAERLLWFIEHPKEATEMGVRARGRVLQHFEINKVVAHQLEIYERLTSRLKGDGT